MQQSVALERYLEEIQTELAEIHLLKGALTYFLGCVAKEYVCGITWKFFATHRSFYNTALVINIEIEQ